MLFHGGVIQVKFGYLYLLRRVLLCLGASFFRVLARWTGKLRGCRRLHLLLRVRQKLLWLITYHMRQQHGYNWCRSWTIISRYTRLIGQKRLLLYQFMCLRLQLQLAAELEEVVTILTLRASLLSTAAQASELLVSRQLILLDAIIRLQLTFHRFNEVVVTLHLSQEVLLGRVTLLTVLLNFIFQRFLSLENLWSLTVH